MAAAVWLLVTPFRTLLPSIALLAFLAPFALAAALSDLGHVELPRQQRQVPQSWYGRHGPIGSYVRYGLGLGAGLATNVTYAAEYTVFLGAGLLLPIASAVIVGALFGLGRTILVGPLACSNRTANRWDSFFNQAGPIALRGLSAFTSVALAAVACHMLLF
jgi:hypothetical protein